MIVQIIAKGFQSWENLNFSITNEVTLIDGFNYDDGTSEGSGKSAILNALCWCLYGKVPKTDVKIDDIIKDGQKDCEVQVLLKHNKIDRIIRSRSPNQLCMVDKNQKVIVGQTAIETQKEIEKVIGVSFDTFCQTYYFAQGFPKKFVTATQEERGKILSEIQDLGVFDRGRKEVMVLAKLEDQKIISLQHDIEINKVKYDGNIRAIKQQQDFIRQQKADLQSREQVYQTQKQQKVKSLEELDTQKITLNEIVTSGPLEVLQNDKVTLDTLLEESQKKLAQIQGQRSNLEDTLRVRRSIIADIQASQQRTDRFLKSKQELTEFIQNPTNICSLCGTTLKDRDTTHAKQELTKVLESLDKEAKYLIQQETRLSEIPEISVKELDQQIIEATNSQSELKLAVGNIKLAISKVEDTTRKLGALDQVAELHIKDIKVLETQILELQQKVIEEDNEVINVLESENIQILEVLESLKGLLQIAQNRVYQLEALKGGFKEVKSYTFNSILNELTCRVNRYLIDLFEVSVNLKFTNENMKIGMDLTMGTVKRGYGLFSGGQQRRVQLAVDLALSDIVAARTGTKQSLLILDEYFKDLSEVSMHKCLMLLEKLGRPIILIEHNSVFKSIVNRTFMIELRNGTSKASV